MENAVKVRENRLRRVAERRGLTLHKTRRRDPRAADYGSWSVVDSTGSAVATGLDLDGIDAELTRTDDATTDAAAARVTAFLDAHDAGKGSDELARCGDASLRAADLRDVLAELERLRRLRAGAG